MNNQAPIYLKDISKSKIGYRAFMFEPPLLWNQTLFFGLRTQTHSLLAGSGLKRFFSIKVILRAGSGDFEPCIEHWVCTHHFHSTCVYIPLMHVINFCLGSAGGHVMLKGSDLFLPTVNNYLLTGDCRLLGVSLLHCRPLP